MPQLEDLHRDKDSLNELVSELRGKLTDLQIQDIDSKATDANDKYTQLRDGMANRFMFILWPVIILWLRIYFNS